jgi:hypothetical protein
MSKFEVGEIAIITQSAFPQFPVGCEVQIRAINGEPDSDTEYFIDSTYDLFVRTDWYANNRCLRKRRPPQDWVALCKLNRAPSELEPA